MDSSPEHQPYSPPPGSQRDPGGPSPRSNASRVAMVVLPILLAAYWGPRRSPPPPPKADVKVMAVRAPEIKAVPVLPAELPKPPPAPPQASSSGEKAPSSLDFVRGELGPAQAPAQPAQAAPPDQAPAPASVPSAADEIEARADEAVNGEPLRDRMTFEAFRFGASARIGRHQGVGAFYSMGAPGSTQSSTTPQCKGCGKLQVVTTAEVIRRCHGAYLGKGGSVVVCTPKKECCQNYITPYGGSCQLVP